MEKLLQIEQFKKKQKQRVILLATSLQTKLQELSCKLLILLCKQIKNQ